MSRSGVNKLSYLSCFPVLLSHSHIFKISRMISTLVSSYFQVRKKKIVLVFFYVVLMLLLVYLLGEFPSELAIIDRKVHFRRLDDFFENEEIPQVDEKQQALLINTTHCQIPEFPPWSDAALKLLERRCTGYYRGNPRCAEKHLHGWSYTNGSYLHINLTAVKESGYSWNSIRCCYRVIIRVEQQYENADFNADNIIKYSKECYPVNKTRQYIDAEFIRFHCISTSLPTFNDVVSREFYAFAQLDHNARNKTQRWMAASSIGSKNSSLEPPNVLIVGVDTMSRISAKRVLNSTVGLLRSLGAVEMKGYMKVGQTTLPNTAAFLSGYNLEDLRNLYCDNTLQTPMNQCPFLWKAYDKLDYLTAVMEDLPFMTSFNNQRVGFVEKPTDFYFRPFMLAPMKHLRRREYMYVRCLGRLQIEQVVLNYMEHVLQVASSNKSPVFAHVWFGSPSHECSLSAKYTDPSYAGFIQRAVRNHPNSVIVFMADHGEPFGEFRETTQGWYEDRLPTIWIYLPKTLRQQYPDWQRSLEINSDRVTSHFDLYKTLVHILRTFDPENKAVDTYQRLKGQGGMILLEPLSESRTCGDAEIPEGYCACFAPKNVDLSSPMAIDGVKVAFNHIAKMLPGDLCEKPILKDTKEVKYFDTPEGTAVYTVTFVTDPGDFLFEATVRKRAGKKTMEVANEILRVNKMTRKAHCVSDPVLQKYCFCK